MKAVYYSIVIKSSVLNADRCPRPAFYYNGNSQNEWIRNELLSLTDTLKIIPKCKKLEITDSKILTWGVKLSISVNLWPYKLAPRYLKHLSLTFHAKLLQKHVCWIQSSLSFFFCLGFLSQTYNSQNNRGRRRLSL